MSPCTLPNTLKRRALRLISLSVKPHTCDTNLGKAYKQSPTRWSRLAEWVL